mgnify:CR=1 FL=1
MPAAAIYDAVVNDLGFAIVSGHYPPGQRLTLSDIEEAHGVSRTVARDAVKTLAALGMVETRRRAGVTIQPRRGWHVLSPEIIAWRLAGEDRLAQIDSLTDVREAIEPRASRLAALHRSDEHADELLRLGATLVSLAERGLGRAPEYLDSDIRFHGLLLEASGNEMLAETIAHLRVLCRLFEVVDPFNRIEEDRAEHLAILEAYSVGDAARAEQAVVNHLRNLGRYTLSRLSNGLVTDFSQV